jgi:hypothetical protein
MCCVAASPGGLIGVARYQAYVKILTLLIAYHKKHTIFKIQKRINNGV